MRLVSVNVALPRTMVLNGRIHHTAIGKQPVGGAVTVHPLGLAGDEVGSPKHHGGNDQAVYVYTVEDYAWWSQELDRELVPGTFGENLTVAGLESGSRRIGDRLRVGGEVVLEVTAPRIPCETLAGRMGDPRFVKRFARALRPGLYVRVIETGSVRAGDTVVLDETSASELLVADLMALHYDRKAPADELERALAAPVAERARQDLEERLARQRRAG
jgi:MOSC domain-containing protein YiiM